MRQAGQSTTWRPAGGSCAESPPTPLSPPTWFAPVSAAYARGSVASVPAPELRADNPEQVQLSLLDDNDGVDDQAVQAQILRARAVLDLADALDAELTRIDSASLLNDMELPVQQVLAGIEKAGIAVDLGQLPDLQQQFAEQIRDAAEAAYGVIGKQINLGSPKQLQVVLFDELEMPKTKRTKTGYTTDADALQSLYRRRATHSSSIC